MFIPAFGGKDIINKISVRWLFGYLVVVVTSTISLFGNLIGMMMSAGIAVLSLQWMSVSSISKTIVFLPVFQMEIQTSFKYFQAIIRTYS